MSDATAWNTSEVRQPGAHVTLAGEGRPVDAASFRQLVDEHHRFIWRLLARLGVGESDVDDATQQVFMVLVQRTDIHIIAGSERAFLFGIALNVAKTHKRAKSRRRESLAPPPELVDPDASPEVLTEQHRARRLLDEILESMPMDLRVPFVLFELDDVSTTEIASLLGVPAGTVASKLRRAREWFDRRVQQLQARTLRGRKP
jgi:RNA polymerase sigma-70 factor, ECF subfamily